MMLKFKLKANRTQKDVTKSSLEKLVILDQLYFIIFHMDTFYNMIR